jgi:hypothetical protein
MMNESESEVMGCISAVLCIYSLFFKVSIAMSEMDDVVEGEGCM